MKKFAEVFFFGHNGRSRLGKGFTPPTGHVAVGSGRAPEFTGNVAERSLPLQMLQKVQHVAVELRRVLQE